MHQFDRKMMVISAVVAAASFCFLLPSRASGNKTREPQVTKAFDSLRQKQKIQRKTREML
jgi:hypothetical protein